MKLIFIYYFFKFFKKFDDIKYKKIFLIKKIFNIYCYQVLGKNEFILTNKKIEDYNLIRFAKYYKFKNYYII